MTQTDESSLRRQIDQLDRDWNAGLANYRIRDRDGNISLPGRVITLAYGIFGSLFGLILIGFALSLRSWLTIVFLIPGLAGLAGFIIQCRMRLGQTARYQRNYQEYQRARQSLLDQIKNA
jgi:hypothetical protein